MVKWFKRIGIFLVLFILVLLAMGRYNLRDRHPDYNVNIKIEAADTPQIISAGFSKKAITPTIIDTWNDVNGNFKYNESDGDTYNDLNGNGEFDATWIAGMSSRKPAQGVHDDVWARAMVIDDGTSRIAMVSLDLIGFFNDEILDIRKSIPKELNIDYALISSTHTHENEDMMGMWGGKEWISGVNPESLKHVKKQALAAIVEAAENLRPANLIFAEDLSGDDGELMKDTRKPIVKATGVHIMQVVDSENGETLGSIVNWANHPESLWGENLQISSDFPHYIREGIEKGVYKDDELMQEGLGGVSVFFNGAVGGLMTPHPSLSIKDPFKDTIYSKPSFDKTKAIGDHVALMSLKALKKSGDTLKKSNLSLNAKTIILPLDNIMFRLAGSIGLLSRGLPELFKTRTEVGAIRIGPALFLSIPGEMYPEIIYGGIEAPEGRDFDIQPLEIPPLQELIKDKYNFYIGLSNDQIGYIIPKSEWDTEKPYLYSNDRSPYGESNSLGSETAPILYRELSTIIKEMN